VLADYKIALKIEILGISKEILNWKKNTEKKVQESKPECQILWLEMIG
jgi:hypothetical protein